MHHLYNFLFYLALPFIFLRLWWRSRLSPAYRERWGERLGYYPFTLKKCIWIHAVSVGETLAAIPLIKALQSRYPQVPILVTTMTPTGAARVKTAFGEGVQHAYLPYDLHTAVQRFLHAMQPLIAIIIETELWPNLLLACAQKHIPVCLANARLSAKSAAGYQRIAALTRAMLQNLTVIAAHSKADAERFIALGAAKERVMITGNIKFDLELPVDLPVKSATLRTALGDNRFIWVAASTHAGEEEIMLAAHKKLCSENPQALLILVPRHPERFDSVATLSTQSFVTARRSQQLAGLTDAAVYLCDTMGELLLMYSVADVTVVGGSFIPRGGHNMLEPGALKKPVLTGPHLFNFAEISALLIAAQALIPVNNAESLATQLISLMQHPVEREQMGARALQVVTANRGALRKQINLICQLVTE